MTRAIKPDGNAQPPQELPPAGLPEQQRADGHSKVEHWRDLARRIQNETDPDVMIELIQQLVVKLDAKKSSPQKREKNKPLRFRSEL